MRPRPGLASSLDVPLDGAAAPPGERELASKAIAQAGDILVVDDNPANLIAVEAALGDMAGRVVRAQSGSEALRYLLDHDCALILLDVQMPSMDGFQTAKLIRQRRRSQDTPIIFVTAYTREDADVQEAYQLGAVDFLFKPVSADVLRAKAAVFVALQKRTAEVARQAEMLRDHERRAHEQTLNEERRRWEEEALRRQRDEAQRAAVALERKAEELARTVNEKARAEHELKRINHELAEADRRKDIFLAMLGHELRNPLASIVTGLELQRRTLAQSPGAQLPTDVGARIERTRATIERQVRHLTRLVDDLLDISRINSGKIELRKASVGLREVIDQAVAATRPMLEEQGHALDVRAPDDPVSLIADGVRLTQVLANLLNNAARYTPKGGSITLCCDVNDEQVVMRVRDNGRGIAPEMLPLIFGMFVQEQEGGGGLGLGLTLVERLVKLHGGHVSAQSDGVGQGSEFVVTLPLADSSMPDERSTDDRSADRSTDRSASKPVVAAEPPRLRVTPGQGARPLRVAIVDDNADIRSTLQELLAFFGHDVQVASDGEAGVELITGLCPDVAFVDIGLPLLDGYGVATQVRATLDSSALRMVAMSGYGRPADRARALASGFDAHLTKPVEPDALVAILDDLLSQDSSEDRGENTVPAVVTSTVS